MKCCKRNSVTYSNRIAFIAYTFVRIVRFGVDSAIRNDELEGVIHRSAIATAVVFIVTVNKLLLRQANQIAGDYFVDSLHGRNG